MSDVRCQNEEFENREFETRNSKLVIRKRHPRGQVFVEFLGWVWLPIVLMILAVQIMGIMAQRTRCVYRSYFHALVLKKAADEDKLSGGSGESEVTGKGEEEPTMTYNWLGENMDKLLKVQCEIPLPNELGERSDQVDENIQNWFEVWKPNQEIPLMIPGF